jgi:hypothetical protein
MTIDIAAISVDCADAAGLAQFWASVLDRPLPPDASGRFAVLAAPDGNKGSPKIAFHQVPEGKVVKNRVHLDLITAEFEAESRRLLELGAARVRDIADGDRIRWTTFTDPEGNEFDLVVG